MFHKAVISTKVLLALLLVSFTLGSCLKEPDFTPNPLVNIETAHARIEITDAPIDDANVSSVFITVADVKIDGKSWAGFERKTTFDLLAYQRGLTKLLGEGELEAGTYSEIILVLDTETDMDGNSPGCYVLDAQGEKRKLEGGSEMQIKANGSIVTTKADTTEAVIDMDLRKSIVYQTGSNTEFKFVTDPELQAVARMMDKSTTGTITGDCTDGVSSSDKIIVYAYKKGTFDVDEKFPQGASQVTFKNAIASAVLATNGTFNLSFLDAGNYELHFISYQMDPQGKLQAKGELQLNVLNATTLNLQGLNVSAKETIDMDLVITGLLFF